MPGLSRTTKCRGCGVEIILIGDRKEIRRWIRRQERMSGKRINYAGVISDNGQDVYRIVESKKEGCPRLRTVRRRVERLEEI